MRLICACILIFCAIPAYAGPMGFANSFMAMGDFSPNWQESFVNYALTSRQAVGIEVAHMQSDDKTLTRQALSATYTSRLQRWNMPHAQANLWFVGGVGAISGNDFTGAHALYTPGILADYETTRIYVSAVARLYRADNLNHDYSAARVGFSLYETDYNQTQPWLVLESRYMHDLSDQPEITPMLRLINARYFIEAGVSAMKQARFNFMYIF